MSAVHYRLEDGVAVLTIDNPPVNALSLVVRQGLLQALQRAAQDADVQAVVLTGAHGMFAAGADIREVASGAVLTAPITRDVQQHMEVLPKPLVAATCGGVRVHSVYVPNGRAIDHEQYEAKLDWLAFSPNGSALTAVTLRWNPLRMLVGRRVAPVASAPVAAGAETDEYAPPKRRKKSATNKDLALSLEPPPEEFAAISDPLAAIRAELHAPVLPAVDIRTLARTGATPGQVSAASARRVARVRTQRIVWCRDRMSS